MMTSVDANRYSYQLHCYWNHRLNRSAPTAFARRFYRRWGMLLECGQS